MDDAEPTTPEILARMIDPRDVLRALMSELTNAQPDYEPISATRAATGTAEESDRRKEHRVRRLTTAHLRVLASPEPEPPEEREARFARLERVREWFLALVGGCAEARDQLFDLHGGRLRGRAVAEAEGCSPSTVSRDLHDSVKRIRWVLRLAATADRCFDEKTKKGFTIDPVTEQPVGPVPTWAVSLKNLGLRLPRRPTPEELLLFVSQRADIFRLGRGRPRYFGGWIDTDGSYWLDVTVLIPDREAAVAFAKRNDQQVIYNLATGETDRIPYRQRRRAA